jgi:hypothetical protein
MSQPITTASPGTYLAGEQARRCECLRLSLELLAGRSVHIATIWAIARWLYSGEAEGHE